MWGSERAIESFLWNKCVLLIQMMNLWMGVVFLVGLFDFSGNSWMFPVGFALQSWYRPDDHWGQLWVSFCRVGIQLPTIEAKFMWSVWFVGFCFAELV
jgi:hypothetical protein